MTRPPLLLPLLLMLTTGCVVLRSDLGAPVADEARLRPGQSAWEAVAVMGPPEEWRSPSVGDLPRRRNELTLRVSEERELFGRRRLTWITERRETDMFLLVPFVTFFGWTTRAHPTDRVVALLDDRGRIEHVAVTREITP